MCLKDITLDVNSSQIVIPALKNTKEYTNKTNELLLNTFKKQNGFY